jgi:enoyl-CoA hydratase
MSVVDYAVADRVARITLNRPARGNGINRPLISVLERCAERADRARDDPFGDAGPATFKG